MNTQEILTRVSAFMNEQVPFQKLLGFEITEFTPERGQVKFRWQDPLMGNVPQRMLHGGVTATALDTAGGLVAIAGMIERLQEPSEHYLMERLSRCGTIDLRVDYLRPGRGKEFIANAAEPGAAFNLVPDALGALFLICIVFMQMFNIWMKK